MTIGQGPQPGHYTSPGYLAQTTLFGVGGKYHSYCNDKEHAQTNKKIEENCPHIKGN